MQTDPSPAPSIAAPPCAWHALPVEPALAACGVDPQRGLDAATVRRRQTECGPNALPEPPSRPLWRTVAHQFRAR